MAMVGTPPKVVIRSVSISSRARSRIEVVHHHDLPAGRGVGDHDAWHPVAWKSGTDSRDVFCALAGVAVTAGPVAEPRLGWPRRTGSSGSCMVLRWVPTAPLGWPVVPEV